ncbi:MAG: hypothetical protein CFE45_04895 [Burkholderiales bacterium PBB5]|nr:MAG: hypothetical protein CFE45_04895 [Burkholderiales bacterium PBB5]
MAATAGGAVAFGLLFSFKNLWVAHAQLTTQDGQADRVAAWLPLAQRPLAALGPLGPAQRCVD